MSISNYLWTVATDLQRDVHSATQEGAPRDALRNSIRILTAIANALDRDIDIDATFLGIASSDIEADTDRLSGPPENAAAHRAAGASIAEISAQLDTGRIGYADAQEEIAWEKRRLDAAIEKMNRAETAVAEPALNDNAQIDPVALEAYLRRTLDRSSLALTSFRPILGGRSRQTALFSISDGADLPERLVVQRTLPGMAQNENYASDEGQYFLLDYIHRAGLRVPRPVLLELDPAVLGAPFILTEQSEGAPIQPDYWGRAQPEQVAIQLAEQLALLHQLPCEPLASRLPGSLQLRDRDMWLADIEEIASSWQRLAHWPAITISAALDWMRTNVGCVDDRRTIVHNDMIFHNILAKDGSITAVLDWEQASIGHPGEDLGYCLPAVSLATDWAKFMAAYAAAGGPAISQTEIDFFALRSSLRMLNLAMERGRDAFEKRGAPGVLVASAGAHWTQRFLHRLSHTLAGILERDTVRHSQLKESVES